MKVWVRFGNTDDSRSFDSMYDAGVAVGQLFVGGSEPPIVTVSYPGSGVEVGDVFSGLNFIALYHGDDDGYTVRDFDSADLVEFNKGIRAGSGFPDGSTGSRRNNAATRRRRGSSGVNSSLGGIQ